MHLPLILDFDHSTGSVASAQIIPLQTWQDSIRFACSFANFHTLQAALDPLLPADYGTVLIGSGDYHHISLLLLQRLQTRLQQLPNPPQIQLVVFDNHPDNMRYPFGIHCGSWVTYAARLPFVRHVHVVGMTSNDISWMHAWENRLTPLYARKLSYWSIQTNVRWARYLGLNHAFHNFETADELMAAFIAMQAREPIPTYLSIDKDVFSVDTVQTNWDQGCLRESHVLDAISALRQQIIASDITGEVSVWRYSQWWKRLLSSLDQQQQVPPQTLEQWQLRQHQLNHRLLQALQVSQIISF